MIKDYKKTAIIAGEREVSYAEMLEKIVDYAKRMGVKAGEKTIIFSENREEWVYAFFSVWYSGGIAVPADATSTVEDLRYIINDCRPESVWTSSSRHDIVMEAMEGTGVTPKVLILDNQAINDNVDGGISANQAISSNIDGGATAILSPWQGKTSMSGTETAVIIYTSGTTGSPKGVMLSYDNLAANMAGVSEEVPILTDKRRVLMLLPVHHILPLMGTIIIPIIKGGGIAICPTMTGPDIMQTLCRGKIGIMIGVPRLWQTLYTGIKKKIDASFVTRTLFNICKAIDSPALSRTVFASIRKKMGGHLDYCVSGGAALDKEIGEGLRTLGLEVLEGYGMTETAPIISFTRPGDIIPGCVGLPLPSVECKIIDPATGNTILPTMGSAVGGFEGELCAKGPNVMQGYYNRPEETAAVIDNNGFVHTGDLARFDEKGRVIITGRLKEIIVLSNGKNVQPNEIEFKLEKYDKMVKEAAVTQDGDMLCAIIVPQEQLAQSLSDEEIEEKLKREVVEPYNLTVENYKKIMRIRVYRGDLPRTKLDKLKRFHLKDILKNNAPAAQKKADANEPKFKEYVILKQYIETEKKLDVHATDHIETDLAFDSLDKVGLQGFIEQTFGTKIDAESMASFKNIQAMAEYISTSHTRMEVEHVDWNKVLNQSSETLRLPHAAFTYVMTVKLFKAFFRLYNRLSIKGTENIPTKGPFIMAPNHQSYMDGPLVMAGVPTDILRDCYFYVTEEHVNNGLLRTLANNHNIILMERRNLKNSIMKMAQVLKQGKNIVIFPEGSRSHTGKTIAFKKTFAILAKELGVPVLPVRISGAYDALPRGRHYITPNKITLEYLPVVNADSSKEYTAIAEEIRRIIEAPL